MDYQPLPIPVPPEIAADLCDLGSPPKGHVRVVITRGSSGDRLVTQIGPNVSEYIDSFYADPEDSVEYVTGVVLTEVLDMLPDRS